MSALGHEQTYALQQAMSAIPPIATEKADIPDWHRVFLRYQKYEADAAMRARDSFAQHDLSLGRRERVGPRANDIGARSGAKTFVETKRKTASRRSFNILLCFRWANCHWALAD